MFFNLRTLTLLIYILSIHSCFGEIHRARGIKPTRGSNFKPISERSTWPPGPHRPVEAPSTAPSCLEPIISSGEEAEIKDSSIDTREYHSFTVWVYAFLSAILVGLSGIFPLLIIPLDAGDSLKSGAGAVRLKLLLSFAVGGLLGDVFLHLLPEAWAHMDQEDWHAGHTRIGLWVIAGLMSFLIIEKAFPDDDEEEEEQQEALQHTQYTQLSRAASESSKYNLKSGHTHNDDSSSETYKENGGVQCHSNESASNGHVGNGDVTSSLHNGGVSVSKKPAQKQTHIKTSGWLNLMANVVDNFTHGLAVAGSYCCGLKVGLLTTCAILLHEIPHEMGDFAILLRSGFDRWQAAKAQLLTALGGVAGALTALCASSVQQAGNSTAWILPFTSGGFIYIALVTVVPDLLKETNPRESVKQVLLLLCGIVSMALVTVLSE